MSGPSPAVAAVRVAVRQALTSLPAGAHVLVACSGGPDSLALAAAAAFVAPRSGLTAGAAVVDHGWHPSSASVAASAAGVCEQLGLAPVTVLDVGAAAAAGRGGPEAAARDARYAALEREADAQGAAAVLLGHTLDDQAETVLLGLARGSGSRSLAGMPFRRGRLVRPLLGVPRATTRAACTDLGLEPHDDPANADPAYTRVRVRGALAQLTDALGPGVPAALARTAEQLALDAEALEGYAAQLLRSAHRDGGYDLSVLAAAPDAVRRRALLAAARDAGAPGAALGSRHVLALDGLVVGRAGRSGQHGGVHLPGGLVAVRRCGTLSIVASGDRPVQATE
jgi:tRNA(Ile)-lysidine synthetase-like protein